MSLFIPTFFIAAGCLFHFQQPSRYEQVMTDNIKKIDQAETVEEYRAVVNTFERIAQKENAKWEPLYYSAYGYIMMSANVTGTGDKDKYLDRALEHIKKSYELAPQEDEVWALEGFVHMIRVSIDPGSRGQQYTPLTMQTLKKAVEIDPKNPRATYLLGRMEFGTAQFFGSDTSQACARLQEAVRLFELQPDQLALAPSWGAKAAKHAASYCSK